MALTIEGKSPAPVENPIENPVYYPVVDDDTGSIPATAGPSLQSLDVDASREQRGDAGRLFYWGSIE